MPSQPSRLVATPKLASVPRPPLLVLAGLAFVATTALHFLAHGLRGVDVTPEALLWATAIVDPISLTPVALILIGSRWAPVTAAVVGFAMALWIPLAHLAPHWSPVSDPLLDTPVDPYMLITAVAKMLSALFLGIAGVLTLVASRREIDSQAKLGLA